MTERWRTIERIFSELVDLPEAARAAHLERSTEGDAELRAELESLLTADRASQGVADCPPVLARELRRAVTGQFLEGRRLGPYLLEGLLQDGGMGMVFRAGDRRSGTVIAVKVLPPEMAARPQGLEQLRREAAALRAMSHPGVVPLIDSGEEGRLHYLVMEFVEGRTPQTLSRKAASTGFPAGISVARSSARTEIREAPTTPHAPEIGARVCAILKNASIASRFYQFHAVGPLISPDATAFFTSH